MRGGLLSSSLFVIRSDQGSEGWGNWTKHYKIINWLWSGLCIAPRLFYAYNCKEAWKGFLLKSDNKSNH